ncbi:hypothetical protein Mrose_03034 [Calidithermus roseus]|uniref:Uncharacterized protein n=1 Tax=Calidithermus roseus TaxID=1644118 RepID=A0A399EFN5_9DEIN|nr:hypothetical protein Mrose_03034 [Calidithermus roseus]
MAARQPIYQVDCAPLAQQHVHVEGGLELRQQRGQHRVPETDVEGARLVIEVVERHGIGCPQGIGGVGLLERPQHQAVGLLDVTRPHPEVNHPPVLPLHLGIGQAHLAEAGRAGFGHAQGTVIHRHPGCALVEHQPGGALGARATPHLPWLEGDTEGVLGVTGLWVRHTSLRGSQRGFAKTDCQQCQKNARKPAPHTLQSLG